MNSRPVGFWGQKRSVLSFQIHKLTSLKQSFLTLEEIAKISLKREAKKFFIGIQIDDRE